jgi:cephalosporin hydroxylase
VIQPLSNWSSEATLRTFHEGTFEQWVLGRKVQKSAQDMKRLLIAIRRSQPELIIETGTRWGGSAGWLAEVSPRDCRVISIDTDPKIGWTSRNVDTAERNIGYLTGDSADLLLFKTVEAAATGLKTMVILDSDHHADHVLREIRLYGELVTPGCYLVVEDACFDFWDGEDSRRGGRQIPEVGGPLKAIHAADLEIDMRWERAEDLECMFEVSHSPCGWWLRK